jgi:L-amino acid N-acyltransferase YncA
MAPIIRLATEDDAPQVLEIYAPFCRGTTVSFETEPPDLDEMRRRIAKVLPEYPWLVCEDQGLILRRRGGIGRALYTSLFAILRLQGYCNALAGVTLPNPGSEGLHHAMGFQPVGVYRNIGYKCGGWHHVAWSQRTLRDPEPEPAMPLPLDAFRGSREWDEAIAEGATMLAGAAPSSS